MTLVTGPSKRLIDEVIDSSPRSRFRPGQGHAEFDDVALGIVGGSCLGAFEFSVVEIDMQIAVYKPQDPDRSIK